MASAKPNKLPGTPCSPLMGQHTSTPMSTYGMSSPDKMSTDNGGLVWVGFIDNLPVIGSVKEAVEFVLAAAHEDPLLAKEKERVMRAKLGLEEKRNSGGSSGSSSGFCSGDEREAVHVEGVPVEELLAVIEAGNHRKGKRSGKRSEKPPAKDQKKMETIRRETERKIQLIDQNYKLQKPLIDTGHRSKKGEHVINNNVIKFHSKVVKMYLVGRRRQTDLDVRCPLTKKSQTAITDDMVAQFETNELYINANALVYGIYCSTLKEALVQLLQDGSEESERWASFIIQKMNECQAYVDELAKAKWIGNKEGERRKFITVRNEVAEMFKNTVQFFKDLRKDILRW